MLDHIPQSVYWKDQYAKYVWCNKRCLEDWGVDAPEVLVGRDDMDEIKPWNEEQARASLADDLRVLETGEPKLNIIEQRTRPDGTSVWLSTNKVPLFNDAGEVVGLMGTSEDISDRTNAEISLRRDHQVVEMIFEKIPFGLLWKDRQARFVGCNAYFAEHAGKTPQELVGLTDYDLPWAETYADDFIADDMTVMESDEPRHQYLEEFLFADGTFAWIQTSKLPLHDEDGEVTGVFITYQDVTKQVELGEELTKMRTAAQEERQRLARDLHDAVSQTLWTASIVADILPALWERDQEKARKNLVQLKQLTRGALSEMRMLLLELRPNSMKDTSYEELLDHLAKATMSRKEIDIDVSIEQDIRLPNEPKMALYRIAQECLNNIIKHSKASKASIKVTQTAQELWMVIDDNGRGFDTSNVTEKGMGLSILGERAEAIQATLEITSRPGKGTTVFVRWPLATV